MGFYITRQPPRCISKDTSRSEFIPHFTQFIYHKNNFSISFCFLNLTSYTQSVFVTR